MGKSTLKAKIPGWKTLGKINGTGVGTAVEKTFPIDYDEYSEIICTAQLSIMPKMAMGVTYGQGIRGYFSGNYGAEYLMQYTFNSDGIKISANRTWKGNLDSNDWFLEFLYR